MKASDPIYHLKAQLFNEITRRLTSSERFIPLSDREAISDAVMGIFAAWLTDTACTEPFVHELAVSLTAHEVDAASATGCSHHHSHDCQTERVALVVDRLAGLVAKR